MPKREKVKVTRRADGSYSRAWRRVSKIILVPGISALMKRDWHGQENFPREGGMILAANHLSYADVLAISLFSYQAGQYPVFLAKSSLFSLPVLGRVLHKLGQLPVYRDSSDAALVLKDAEAGIRNGAGVIFYPEATVSRDPDQWPMVAKTGVARLALSTGVPVVPVAHWGAQRILPYGSPIPRLIPRKTVHILAGPPVDLSEFAGQPLSNAVLRVATDKIMKEITALLGQLRGETPPPAPFHPAVARRAARQAARAAADAEKTGPAGGAAVSEAGADTGEAENSAVTGDAAESGSAEAKPS
jgi:1-acyl-sn-glycerol-3-phosphate acyltransferase